MIGECARCGQTTTVPTVKAVLRWHRQHPCAPAAADEAAPEPPATATAETITSAQTPAPAEPPAASPTAPAHATPQGGAPAATTTSTGPASTPEPARSGPAAPTITPALMPETRVLTWSAPDSSTSSDWDAYAEPADNWRDDALCAQVDTEMFFPEKGESTRAAKATCSRCPVTEACLRYALDHQERFGVWGGKSERERRRLQRSDAAEAS